MDATNADLQFIADDICATETTNGKNISAMTQTSQEIFVSARNGDVSALETHLEYLASKDINPLPLIEKALDVSYHHKKWAAVAYLANYLADISIGETSGGGESDTDIMALVTATSDLIEFATPDGSGIAIGDIQSKKILHGDEIVIPDTQITIEIAFPLASPHKFVVSSNDEKGFTKSYLAEAIARLYERIYDEEAKTTHTAVGQIPGLDKRNRTNGTYGIWGYDISELVMMAVRRGEREYLAQVSPM